MSLCRPHTIAYTAVVESVWVLFSAYLRNVAIQSLLLYTAEQTAVNVRSKTVKTVKGSSFVALPRREQ